MPSGEVLRHGSEQTWYPSGAKEWQREFDHGRRIGHWRGWYADGARSEFCIQARGTERPGRHERTISRGVDVCGSLHRRHELRGSYVHHRYGADQRRDRTNPRGGRRGHRKRGARARLVGEPARARSSNNKAKALRKAICDVFGKRALIQRCQLHKRRRSHRLRGGLERLDPPCGPVRVHRALQPQVTSLCHSSDAN